MDRNMMIDGKPIFELDLYYKELPPVPTAERHVEPVPIKGRTDGELTKKYGYLNINYPIELYFYEDKSFRKTFRQIKPYLLDAKTISFADDNEVYYKVKSVSIEMAESDIYKLGMFLINFTLDPFMYEIKNEQITITSSTTITNDGYDCLPIIEVTSAGSGRIFINDNEILITNINGKIVIDSEQKNAYRPGNPPLPANNRMEGDFPIILNGDNRVRFNGDISKLEITLNKRWR